MAWSTSILPSTRLSLLHILLISSVLASSSSSSSSSSSVLVETGSETEHEVDTIASDGSAKCLQDPLDIATTGNTGSECSIPGIGVDVEGYDDGYFDNQIVPSQLHQHRQQQQNEQQNQQQVLLAKRQDPPAPSQSINVPQDAPVGGLTITQPPATAQATYYKIARDNFVTFGWSFTDLVVTPQRLTLQAYCSQNGFTYPVGPTQGIAGGSTQFAWDPYQYEQGGDATPLAEASYTLRIFDERGYGAAPSGGYLRTYMGTVFALYRPQPYVALADGWKCAACSAAMRSSIIHPAVLATLLSCLGGALLVFLRI